VNIVLKGAEVIVDWFWKSCEVKGFVVHLLEKYAASTDNDVDDVIVSAVKNALMKGCK